MPHRRTSKLQLWVEPGFREELASLAASQGRSLAEFIRASMRVVVDPTKMNGQLHHYQRKEIDTWMLALLDELAQRRKLTRSEAWEAFRRKL